MSSIYDQLGEACRRFGESVGMEIKEAYDLMAKNGKKERKMKYTFEIMKEYEDAFRGISVYSVSEDKKLMVDFVAMEELEDAQKEIDEAYQRGINDAWEAAKKLFSSMADSDIEKAFPTEWNNGGFYALMNLQPQEAIAKLKAYEEEQKADEEIKVGDVVKSNRGWMAVVTQIDDDGLSLMDSSGAVASYSDTSKFSKTGRHFDIDKILGEMKK